MNDFKLTIAIPTYNRADLLRKALDSILTQTKEFNNVDIFVSDNASEDNTHQIIRPRLQESNLIKYSRNTTNLGIDGNVVKCVENSFGDYIFFLSDDDIVLPGTLKHIMKLIENHRPTMICLSHYGFEGDDYLTKTKVFFPEEDKFYENGKDFFLYAGLGFLSSLIVRTSCARQFLKHVRIGKCCAHLDIVSRVSLKMKGPFIFLGTRPIAARVPTKIPQGHDLLLNGFIYVNQLYRDLQKENLLSEDIVNTRERSLIKSLIPKTILNQIVMGDYKRIYSQRQLVKDEMSSYWEFYIYVYPLFFIPRILLILPYKFTRYIIVSLRHYRLRK